MIPTFLTLDEVLALHAHQIRRYGGTPGLRDIGLLQSAVAVPRATYAGTYLHATLAEHAAAYLFHLAKNHPFVDGNKRVGLAAALAFLALNETWIDAGENELVDLVVGVVTGSVAKSAVAVFFDRHRVPL